MLRLPKRPKTMISNDEAARLGAEAASDWFNDPRIGKWPRQFEAYATRKSKTITPTRRAAFFEGCRAVARLREDEFLKEPNLFRKLHLRPYNAKWVSEAV